MERFTSTLTVLFFAASIIQVVDSIGLKGARKANEDRNSPVVAKVEADYAVKKETEDERRWKTINQAIESATATIPKVEQDVVKQSVEKALPIAQQPIHLAAALLLPKELHKFPAHRLDGSVAAELAKVKMQLQNQNHDIAKALIRQKAVADKMANAVAEKLKAQKVANAQLQKKLGESEKKEKLAQTKLAQSVDQWNLQKQKVVTRISSLKSKVDQLNAEAKKTDVKNKHLTSLEADVAKQKATLQQELQRLKSELSESANKQNKERSMLFKMIEAKKKADARIRELTTMAKGTDHVADHELMVQAKIIQAKKKADARIRALTKMAKGSSHVAAHVGSAASAAAAASEKHSAPIAAGPAAIAKQNQELARELSAAQASLNKVKEEQKKERVMLWKMMAAKKKADARVRTLKVMVRGGRQVVEQKA